MTSDELAYLLIVGGVMGVIVGVVTYLWWQLPAGPVR